MPNVDELLKEFSVAEGHLARIDAEEQNWRNARLNVHAILEAARNAAALLTDLDGKITHTKNVLSGLEGEYKKKRADLESAFTDRENVYTVKLEAMKAAAKQAEDSTKAKIAEANESAVLAEKLVSDTEARINEVKERLLAEEQKLEDAKRRHADFIKSITGGK